MMLIALGSRAALNRAQLQIIARMAQPGISRQRREDLRRLAVKLSPTRLARSWQPQQ